MQQISWVIKMKNQDILKLICNRNCYAQVNVCVYQTWESYKSFSCIDAPKENDLLLFVNHCKVTYSMKDGETFSLNHGDIVYIPTGKEYTLKIDRDNDYGCTYGINFLLFDEEHTRLILENNQVFSDNEHLKELFKKMSVISDLSSRSFGQLHSLFYQIIVALNEGEKSKDIKNFSVIEKGIRYIENDVSLLLSVREIADMCNVSQNYFCRLFKEYAGLTPQDYILNAKIEKAKILLRETSLSVFEVAGQAGFQDPSYFCRIFKRKTGVTPLKFRNFRNTLSVDKICNMNV